MGPLVLVLAPLVSVWADRIELNNGTVFEGRVVRLNGDEVSMVLRSGGVVSFRNRDLHSLHVSGVGTISSADLALLDELPRSTAQYRRMLTEARNAAAPSPGHSWQRDANASMPRARPPQPPSTTRLANRRSGIREPRVRVPTIREGGLQEPAAPPQATVKSPAGALGSTVAPQRSPSPIREVRPTGVVRPGQSPGIARSAPPLAFEFDPPAGFAPWAAAEMPPVVKAYRDPVTEATLTIASYTSERTPRQLKDRAAQTYGNQSQKYQVTRDEAFLGGRQEGWVLEVTSRLAGLTVEQMQMFTGVLQPEGSRVLVVTLSTASPHFPRYREPLLRSLRALRVQAADTDTSPPESPPPVEPSAGESLPKVLPAF